MKHGHENRMPNAIEVKKRLTYFFFPTKPEIDKKRRRKKKEEIFMPSVLRSCSQKYPLFSCPLLYMNYFLYSSQ